MKLTGFLISPSVSDLLLYVVLVKVCEDHLGSYRAGKGGSIFGQLWIFFLDSIPKLDISEVNCIVEYEIMSVDFSYVIIH